MNITYLGHSALAITLNDGTNLIVDPFISGNPLVDVELDTLHPDYILLTHGHYDHIGDAVELANVNNATIVGMMELMKYMKQKGVQQTHGLNLGGGHDFDFGRIQLTPALHSSGLEEEGQLIYLGEAAGILIKADGKTIYHAGDTADFSDLALIGEQHEIDCAFLPIGDNFTMGPKEAARAAKRLQAKRVVPIHYNTFPAIKQDPEVFVAQLEAQNGYVMQIGETIEVS